MLNQLEILRKEAQEAIEIQNLARNIHTYAEQAQHEARDAERLLRNARAAVEAHNTASTIAKFVEEAAREARDAERLLGSAKAAIEAQNAASTIAKFIEATEREAQNVERLLGSAKAAIEAQNAASTIKLIEDAERTAYSMEQYAQGTRTLVNPLTGISALSNWEDKYLGKKGAVTSLLRSVGSLPKEERADFGKRANEIKAELTATYTEQEKLVKEQELARDLESGAVDVTLPGRPHAVGGLHPSTQMLRNFYNIWAEMGFQVYRSRDVEDDETNFTLLNIPPHHPARDMWDTFHTTTPGVILRTHTSPGQIRSMREYGENGTLPIRVILPGMCYRYEQVSVRSEIQFNQVEGVCIGKNIRMTDLKGTISEFARRMFSPQTKVRFRSSYFPFTEPSMEVDAECLLCHGEGCAMCKYSGWLEIAGCGMMHPVVLENGGYDPSVWSGFAFGMGPERMINLKYGVRDIRYYWGNDLRFLEQF